MRRESSDGKAMVASVLALTAVVGLASIRAQPPSPLAIDAPEQEFSARRALVLLQEILGESEPHPVASPAGGAVRERVVSILSRLSLDPEIQSVFTCGGRLSRTCAPVENILARIPGQEEGPAVLLVSHYDSVPAGPGAADDAAAVATMAEIGRALLASGPPRHPVILLVDEGEEVGLLGAQAFLDHPWAQDVAVVVNLEARGTSGLSILFETSDDNAWLLDAYQGATSRPTANSLSYEVYRRMPNDTDLSVFKDAGYPGINLAFIEEVAHYHTPLDCLENLDPGSVQHQGESALATVRALAAADLSQPRPDGNSVYLDVLGFALARWPEAWALAIAFLPLLALGLAGLGLARRRELSGTALLWGALAWLGGLALAAAAGFVMTLLLAVVSQVPRPWFAHPLPTRAALWLLTAAAVLLATALVSRRGGFWGLALGAWWCWAVVGLVLAVIVPGASAVFVLPALLASALLAGAAWRPPGWGPLAVVAASAGAGMVWFPLISRLETSFGLESSPGVTVPLALVFATAAPVWGEARRQWAMVAALAVAGVAVGLVTLLLPVYSTIRPQPLNLVLHQDADRAEAQWVIGRPAEGVPVPLREAAGLDIDPVAEPFPWSRAGSAGYVGRARITAVDPPEMVTLGEEMDGEGRRISSLLRSPRGARSVFLFLPEGAAIESVAVDGNLARLSPAGPRYRSVSIQGLPPEGLTVDLELADRSPLEILVADRSDGLPGWARPVEKARPEWAVPRGHGDVFIVQTRVRL